MIKKSLITLGLLCASTNAVAANQFYIGAGAITGSGTHSTTYEDTYGTTLAEDETDIDTSGYSIKIGKDNGSSRVELSYTSIDFEFQNSTENAYGIDLDWVKPFGSSSLKPFITLGAGYHAWKDREYRVQGTTDSEELKAISLNAGAGIIYSLGRVELEAAYKFKKYFWQDIEYVGSNGTVVIESQDTTISGLYVGVNFRF